MDALEKCKKARTAAKTRLTLVANKVRDITSDTNISKQELIQIVSNFELKLKTFDETQSAVEELLSPELLESEIEHSEAFREEKVCFLVKAKELLETQTNQTESLSDTRTSSNSHAKLPQLELPKFNGDHIQWQSFWDKFAAVVHNSDLPPVSKFTYLQSLLKGDALSAISGLSLTEGNYKIAIDILTQRFGRKERIVFGHVQHLLNIPAPGKSISDLWSLYDNLQTHIRCLESLDVTGDRYGVILTPLVLHKLPENIRLEWARLKDGKESDLESLLKFLHGEILRRERSQTFRPESSGSHKPHSAHGSKYSTAAALHIGVGKNEREQKKCHVCDKGHLTHKCFSWNKLDPEGRKAQCYKKGLCFLCLGLHRVKTCKANIQCDCSGKHHPLLCPNIRTQGSIVNNEHSSTSVRNQVLRVQHTNNSNSDAVQNKHALLQTATVKVKVESDSDRHRYVNILFDSGAERSYISSSCARDLGLIPIDKVKVSVALFGQAKPSQPQWRNRYCLNFPTKNITVIETPMICSPIHKPKLPPYIVNKLRESGLTIADGSIVDYHNHMEIDVLVGLDYFWQLVKPNVTRITESLSAQETDFGWILSGSWAQNDMQAGALSHQFLCMTDIPESLCHQLWDLNTIGIREDSLNDQVTDGEVLGKFNHSVIFDKTSARYTVNLPWKPDKRDILVNNKTLALKRADNLKRRLGKDPALEREYNAVISEMEKNNIIHEVPAHDIDNTDYPVYYLPHRPVIRDSSLTTKIRPVFDASAKIHNGLSLNNCMEAGLI